MQIREIYLDNNATTLALPEVVEAVTRAMQEGCGNPSSVHTAGARARTLLGTARAQVAAAVAADPRDVLFTSGASEANNLVVQSLIAGPIKGYRLVTSVVEHSSILTAAEVLESLGLDVVTLPVDTDGLIDEDAFADAIIPGRTLASVQWANNETGVVQPIPRLVERAHALGALFHTDAVQAVGKLPIDVTEVPVDFLSVSAHKLHGPLGVGALFAPEKSLLQSLVFGGTQEDSLRPGTENVPGIVGFGVALSLRHDRFESVAKATREMRDAFELGLVKRGLVRAINGSGAGRLPGTSNLHFLGIDGEALTIRLDQMGVRCSQSSACTNQRPEPSYVLRAMGLTESEAYASVRFSFSELNTMRDVEDAVEAIASIHASLARFAVA